MQLFVLTRLIQSQPQLGTPSATTADDYPHIFAGVFAEDLVYFIPGGVSYLNHIYNSPVVSMYLMLLNPRIQDLISASTFALRAPSGRAPTDISFWTPPLK